MTERRLEYDTIDLTQTAALQGHCKCNILFFRPDAMTASSILPGRNIAAQLTLYVAALEPEPEPEANNSVAERPMLMNVINRHCGRCRR